MRTAVIVEKIRLPIEYWKSGVQSLHHSLDLSRSENFNQYYGRPSGNVGYLLGAGTLRSKSQGTKCQGFIVQIGAG